MNSDIDGDSLAFNLDHLVIMSMVFTDLGLVEKLNQRLPVRYSTDCQQWSCHSCNGSPWTSATLLNHSA